MLFTIQAYLEDYFSHRNLRDPDGYAVLLANFYFHRRSALSDVDFLRQMRRIKTVFFENNSIGGRPEFERSLLERLDKRFKKKVTLGDPGFPGGTDVEKRRLQNHPRRTVQLLLREFKHAVEAKAIDSFWLARTKRKLRQRPEKIAQSLFAVFAMNVLGDNGIVLREVASGIGFIDVEVILSRVLHIVELKVLTDDLVGLDQLEQYMRTERRSRGYLLVIDALPPDKKQILPTTVKTQSGIISLISVDVNPCPPSRL